MWFLAAVIVLMWGTEMLSGVPDYAMPPLARWGIWTLCLLMCGVASIYADYGRFHDKALGWLSLTLFYATFPMLWSTYLTLIPSSDTFAWGLVFAGANVILPLILVSIGPLLPVVRTARS